MEIHYVMKPRYIRALCLVLLLALVVAYPGYSQSRNGFEEGVIRIKVSEELAAQISAAKISQNSSNLLVTGIQSLDRVNLKVKAKAINRVFREAGKFESKHRRYGLHLWYEIRMDKASSVLSALQDYKGLPQVIISEPIYKKAIIGSGNPNFGPVVYNKNSLPPLSGPSNDPLLGAQWHYNNTGQTGGTSGADISLIEAWGIETGSTDVIVAITDGGVQVNHPDLAANIWVNTDEIPGNNIDDDANGYVDDINGYGFGDGTGNIAPDAHGTHVGGTIAAVTNNGIGVAGVAGGSGSGDGVRIMSLAAFGANDTGGFADTYTYGADNGAVISQNSWGYTLPGVFEQAVLDGIDYFIAEAGRDELGNQVGPMNGGIVFFAAGNSDSDEQHYPGFYESSFAVSGTTHQDKKAWYSNFGLWVEIAAPGGETNSVAQQGVLSTLSNNQYGFFQGTSMACPHVSGLAALIVSKFGGAGAGLTPEMVKARLMQTSDDIDAADPDFAGLLGVGRINAFAALQEDDDVAPVAISDLVASSAGITTMQLNWTAPSDAGSGSASSYDLRYSTAPITEENFESATAVSGEPSPAAAGTPEQFIVTGLTPGTLYYFAIKSADFFGNASAISNVPSLSTNFAPVAAVSPPSLSVNLVTAQTVVENLLVQNDGDGPLNFWFHTTSPHAQPSPSSGTVPAHSSQNVQVTIDANGLLSGTYSADLILASNDPANDSITVPVTINVADNGEPIAELVVDTVDFGAVFQGFSYTKPFTIRNNGSDTLEVTSIVSNNPAFQGVLPGTLKIGAFQQAEVQISLDAAALGFHSAILDVHTNDPVSPVLNVFAFAEVNPAPAISVSPDSLYEELNTGQSSSQYITISNNGGTTLNFTAEVSGAAQSIVTSTTIDVPVSAASSSAAEKSRPLVSATGVQKIEIRSVGQLAAVTNVLILTPDDDVTDIEAVLDAFADIEADVFPKASLPSINLSAFAGYDIVFTTNNTQWLGSGGVDPAVIGDLLADYVDAGGKVIVNQFAYSYDAWQMQGRFIDENYGPFTPSTTDAVVDVSLGTILAPGHILLDGVSAVDYSGYVQNVGLTPGATAVAEWSNGELFLAANQNAVALNVLPSLGNGGAFQWTGQLGTVLQNAVHYLSGPAFVTVTPVEGSVEPGASVDLTVTFDATGLANGLHHASVDILSDDPSSPTTSVPVTLNVLGPQFTVDPDSLYAEVEQGGTTSQSIILSNNGLGDYAFDVSVVTHGSSSVTIKKISAPAARSKAGRVPTTGEKKNAAGARVKLDLDGILAIGTGSAAGRQRTNENVLSVDQYATDFETFLQGDITGQEGWFGQFGNWTVEGINPSSGGQHFRGLSDGLGQSVAFSPEVAIGSEAKSTVSMKANIPSDGTTWQIIPQSPSAGFLNTRIQFSPDQTVQALVSDGMGGAAFVSTGATTPSGYFDLTIEVDRATAEFRLLFNGEEVFTGLGFAGDIEQLVILSLMETAGPVLDIDDLQIIDGTKEFQDPYITASPTSGDLPANSAVEITITYDASELAFGTYSADVVINVSGLEILTVPTTLRVFGEPAILVDPTVLQAEVPYKGDTTQLITIQNTGGNPLEYSLQVIGADTDVAKLPPSPVSKYAGWAQDRRIVTKLEKDAAASQNVSVKTPAIEIRTGTPLYTENFDGGSFPPAGWEVIDNEGTGVVWDFAAAWGEGNYSGTGEAATASSDAAGEAEFDTELITPWIDASGFKNIALQYNVNYQNFASQDFLNVDIQVAGSSSWTNVLSWNEDHGSFRGTPGVFVSLVLDDYLAGASSFRVRWHYFDPNAGDFDWYAQIDDISILGDARAWLAVSPASGVVPVRGTAAVAAEFDAEDLEPGFYVAGILVRSNATNTPLVGVVASLDVLRPSAINVEPDDLKQKLFVGEIATQTLTISNSGESPLEFSIEGVASAGAPAVAKERVPTVVRTSRNDNNTKVDERLAIAGPARKLAGTELYATSFEEFATGDISGQFGWSGQFGNWAVEGINPYSGAQHLRSLSDGLGQTLAFSPEVLIGTNPISSTTARLNVQGSGVTWQVIPQSPTAGLVNTRFEISPDGSMRTLIDTLGGIYVTVPGTWPSGYNELRLDFVRATKMFTVYINGAPVFSGKGFAGDIEQVVLLSLMEDVGQTLDVDNLAIIDGTPSAPWLTVNPLSGTVPAGASVTINATFNAADLEGGNYYDTLNISSNDPASPWTYVPVALTVESNIPPVLAEIVPRTVLEKQIASVTFTATDVDDSVVTVQLIPGYPAFITPTGSGSGYASYNIKPLLGDAGTYDLAVQAIDARGAMDIDTFKLTVVQFAVTSFSLVNITTGEVISTFTDNITINRALPGFANLNIQANTTPGTVGSVKFKVNGSQKNIDNTNPYWLKGGYLAGLGVGNYTLFGEPFTENFGHGQRGVSKTATITIINATTVVSSFTLVNTVNGDAFPIVGDTLRLASAHPDFVNFNIRANTTPAVVGSVKFKINGSQRNIDNTNPYLLLSRALQGLAPGTYTIFAEPFTETFGHGTRGQSKTLTLILDAPAAGARKNVTDEAQGSSTIVSVFPIPVKDLLTIDLKGRKVEGDVEIVIINPLGQVLHRTLVASEKLQGYQISTQSLGMRNGVYYLKLQSPRNLRETAKFIKE
jgi:subtilisin family serine protease